MVFSTNTILAHSGRMIYFRENSNEIDDAHSSDCSSPRSRNFFKRGNLPDRLYSLQRHHL